MSINENDSVKCINIFPFPGKPYPQQLLLMHEIYNCIESSSVGIFESPTGTGKSLSVICSSLYWLQNEERKIITEYEEKSKSEGFNKKIIQEDWLNELLNETTNQSFAENDCQSNKLALKNYYDLLTKIKKSNNTVHISNSARSKIPVKKSVDKLTSSIQDKDVNISKDDEEFVLPDYDSDSKDDDNDDDADDDKNESCQIKLPQIFYCTRTHSQISQFIDEVKKYPSIYSNEKIRCVTIGSRKNLCINESLKKKYSSDIKLTEVCININKNKVKVGKKRKDGKSNDKISDNDDTDSCSFHNNNLEHQFAYNILSDIQDIEDLVISGKSKNTCPYYSTKKSTTNAQVICMPYNILLDNNNRSTYKINLSNNVIIFDEAHNLIDTINQINSCDITYEIVNNSIQGIQIYLMRFKLLLNYKNNLYIQILLSLLNKLKDFIVINNFITEINNVSAHYMKNESQNMASDMKRDQPNQKLLSVNNFLFDSKLDNINIFKLYNYLKHNNIIYRIGGYVEYHLKKENIELSSNNDNIGYITSLKTILKFINCLQNNDLDGRIVIDIPNNSLYKNIKFVLLNPSNHFYNMISSARSIILLGGTMKPFNYVISSLFPKIIDKKIKTFSCNHIVSPNNVAAIVIKYQSNSKLFDFTYNNRHSSEILNELFLLLHEQIVPTVKKGVVVFFTSYNYMNYCIKYFQNNNSYNQLNSMKTIYIENKAISSDQLLSEYTKDINTKPNGAMIFCVIGGKLSEGINFSNDLARCVVVLGMPYADSNDIILQEKSKLYGKQIYDLICLKLINQSIGRSIRHINDYSSIILVDKRYDNPSIISQLPNWINQNIEILQQKDSLKDKLRIFLGKFS